MPFSSLRLSWIITLIVAMLLCFNVFLSVYGGIAWQSPLPESDRLFWRTLFYCITIVLMPFTNLLRYVLLRLNQTMPLLSATAVLSIPSIAKKRYALTISVTQLMMYLIGTFGGIAFYVGEGLNTLLILTAVALMGVYFHRPKRYEYQTILDALRAQNL